MMKCKIAALLLITLFGTFSVAFAAPAEKITNRKNVAAALFGATAEVVNADGSTKDANSILQNSHKDNAAVSLIGTPATLVISFSQPEQINLIRIYPGMLIYALNPSGEAGISAYKIERFNNGYFHPLLEAKEMPSFAKSGAKNAEEYYFEHSFAPIKAEKIRITVLKSGHSGRSASQPDIIPPEKRTSLIRSVEVYSSKRSNQLSVHLRDALEGDFSLRLYRNASVAKLHLKGIQFDALEAVLSIAEEKSNTPLLTRDVRLVKGPQIIDIPLKAFPDGRFILTIKAKAPDSLFKGEIRRMLRTEHLLPVSPPQGVIVVSDMKLFPVDDFHFAERTGVENFVPEAESIEISHRMGFGNGRQDGRSAFFLSIDNKGNYVSQFTEADNKNNRKTFYASSSDLKNWSVAEQTPTGKKPTAVKSPFAPLPPAAIPRWGIKTPFAQAKLRFYDPDKDGKFSLSEIRVQWFPPTLGDLSKHNLKPWTTYPVWEKNGEWLLLTKEPLYIERFDYSADALENEIDCNDNFGNQFLSDDGKTLFVGKAGRLRTFAPYTIEYDNIPEAYRIMRIYYTHDGVNWQYKYFAPPDDKDPVGFQHYGYSVQRVERNFYIAYLHAYPCFEQQIYPEICYSRDGLTWMRLKKRNPFVRNSPPDGWIFGMIFIESSPTPFEHDDFYYLPLGACWRRPHFYIDTNVGNVTGEALRRKFESRGLSEQWPYFKYFGTWDKLAESMQRCALNTVGLAKFRKDGFIAVKSGKNGGHLISRPLSAPNCELLLNAKGKLSIELTSPNGKLLPGFRAEFSGDSSAKSIIWENGAKQLPGSPFCVVLKTAANTELYTLHFKKINKGN
ncbi:MAG: hypothetical protein LBM70_08105 [Victivallales bacterium]|jgi:hypothetical protein|nr:hypothetical protein [Victivallales bacterium]